MDFVDSSSDQSGGVSSVSSNRVYFGCLVGCRKDAHIRSRKLKMEQSVISIIDDVKELLNELNIVRLEERRDIPWWPTRIFDEQLDSYRITNRAREGPSPYGFDMTVPLEKRIVREWSDDRRHKTEVDVDVTDDVYAYVSPVQMLRPDTSKMMVRPVKIPELNMSGQVNFRRMLPDGRLEPSISEESHKEIIVALLERLFPDEIYGQGFLQRITSDEALERAWIPAFTHESYDPNIGQNYERLEFLGDSVMETSFRTYLIKKFPNFTQGEYTAMASHYMSTNEQYKVASDLGIMNAIRSNVVPNPRMGEDVVEAIYGVLLYLTGFRIINRFTEEIYDSIDVDPRYRHQNHKTSVVQYFSRRGISRPLEIIHTLDRGQESMSLAMGTREDLDKLLEYIPDIPWTQTPDGYVIADGEVRRSRRAASSSVYDVLFDIIEELGTFDLPIPPLDDRFQRCLDGVYGEHYRDYQVITLRDVTTEITLAIRAHNRSTDLLENLVTMTIPILSGSQAERRRATFVFLDSICRSLER